MTEYFTVEKNPDLIDRKVIEDIKAEIHSLAKEPAHYVPNYDAYKRCIDIIDKHCGKENE